MTINSASYIRLYIVSLIILLIGNIQVQAITREGGKVQSDSTLITYINNLGIETTTNNQVKLLKSGEEKFIDLFDNIEKAKHHVHLEYFNFRNDSIANALFELLAKKAKEGVEIRAIFDAFGNFSNNQPLKKKHLKEIREKGIEIVKFDPLRFPWINHVFHRDHRKIVVIDGQIGYTGGMNIADYYIEGLPEIGDWRDMHIRVEGTAVTIYKTYSLTCGINAPNKR
jgi:cardiolipin synthase